MSDNKGIKVTIPHEVLTNKDLTYGERVIFLWFISEFQFQNKKVIEISIREFARIYGIDKKLIMKTVRKLVDLKYIKHIKELNDKGTFYPSEFELLKYTELLN